MILLVDMIVNLICEFKRNTVPNSHLKKAAEADKKAQAKKNVAIKEQAAADAARMTTVGVGGKDTKSTSAVNDSIDKNLAS